MPRRSNPAAPEPPSNRNILNIGTLPQHQPREWIPDIYPQAQQAQSSIVSHIPVPPDPGGGEVSGHYFPETNTINILSGARIPAPHIAGHEAGHAIYINDLAPQQQADWNALHYRALRQMRATRDPRTYVPSIIRYMDDPAHSFADAYGMYVNDPQTLQSHSPEVYNFIRNMSGFEYSRKRR